MKLEKGKGAARSKRPAPQWCPRGITKTQKWRLQKMCQRELAKKKEVEERDYWFNRLRPMTKPKQTLGEKWLAKEEGSSSGDSNGEEVSKVTLTRKEDNPGSGDGNLESGNYNPDLGNCHPESGNCNLDSGNNSPGKENDRQGGEPVPMDVNLVFMTRQNFVRHGKTSQSWCWVQNVPCLRSRKIQVCT
jgi:hypothetical protein